MKTTVEYENRGSYMSAHVLLDLLNELRKRDKMRGLPSILSLFSQQGITRLNIIEFQVLIIIIVN